jgi:hypothetical protein
MTKRRRSNVFRQKVEKDFILEVLGEDREVILTIDTWEEAVKYAKKHLDNSGQKLNLEAPKRVEIRTVSFYICKGCRREVKTDTSNLKGIVSMSMFLCAKCTLEAIQNL